MTLDMENLGMFDAFASQFILLTLCVSLVWLLTSKIIPGSDVSIS